jgi:hypothetical protein
VIIKKRGGEKMERRGYVYTREDLKKIIREKRGVWWMFAGVAIIAGAFIGYVLGVSGF